jgi:HSP90 family molecular chaperone
MSYFYGLLSYVWGNTAVDKISPEHRLLISGDELREKIALITKNKKEPYIIEGYGTVKKKKNIIVFVKKQPEIMVNSNKEIQIVDFDMMKKIREYKFKKIKRRAVSDKSWTKVAETSKEQIKSTLNEIAKIKKNLLSVKYDRSFEDGWKNMTKYDKKKWKLIDLRKSR